MTGRCVHEWADWTPSTLSGVSGVPREARWCRQCGLYEDRPVPAPAKPFEWCGNNCSCYVECAAEAGR